MSDTGSASYSFVDAEHMLLSKDDKFSQLYVIRTSKQGAWGRPDWRLEQPLIWYVGKNATYTVPAGFKTDFASIPPVLWWWKADDKDWKKASVMHDWLCKLAKEGAMTYKKADDLYYEALRDDGASRPVAYAFWAAVRAAHKLKGLK